MFVITKNNVDYAALLWWDFMNNVNQKKEAIQYPRFIKLIIAYLMKKFLNIPQRIDEDYHSIKDDILLVSVFTTGNVLVRGMLIPDEFLIVEIRATYDFKEYEMVFMNVVVPMNQPQPIVSTQGTYRSSPRAHRTPTLTAASPEGKKRKQTTRESSSQRKSQKITIKKKKQSTTLIPPPGDDRERDEVAKPTILSLILHKTALAAEAQENIVKVQEKLDEGEIEKLEPGSHKENLENVIDNDEEIEKEKKDKEIEKETNIDDVEKSDEVVKEKDIDVATGSMEFRKENMQTPIPSPTRPSRKIQEVLDHCNKVVPDMKIAKTNEIIKWEMPHLVILAVNKDHEVDPINA
ncbi:hypothetical protein Tco_1354858 [Tanacetum coccineum]